MTQNGHAEPVGEGAMGGVGDDVAAYITGKVYGATDLVDALTRMDPAAREATIAALPPDARVALAHLLAALRRHQRQRMDPTLYASEVLGIARDTLYWSLREDAYRASGRRLTPRDDDEFVARYLSGDIHPDGWEGWDGTPDPIRLAGLLLARGHSIAVAAATGVQKTHSSGWLALWFLDRHPPDWGNLVRFYSTDLSAIRTKPWAEMLRYEEPFKKRHPRLKASDSQTTLELIVDPDHPLGRRWGAAGKAPRRRAGEDATVAAQGDHASFMFNQIDEMPGAEQATVNSIENTSVGYRNVIAGWGNPDNQDDPLAVFGRQSSVVQIRISAHDHVNVVTGNPFIVNGAVTRESIPKRIKDKYHGDADHPAAKSRIRGITPTVGESCLFSIHAIEGSLPLLVDADDLDLGAEEKRKLGITELPPKTARRIAWPDGALVADSAPDRLYRGADDDAGSYHFEPRPERHIRQVTLHEDREETFTTADGRTHERVVPLSGQTYLFHPPQFGYVDNVLVYLDVAGSKKTGDAHAATFLDRLGRRPLALVHMRGDVGAFVTEVLRVCHLYAVPWPDAGRWQLPLLSWETNGVGNNLHNVSPELLAYENLLHTRNPTRVHGRGAGTPGFFLGEDSRDQMVRNLRTWGAEVEHDPRKMVSARMWLEAKTFVKREVKRGKHRYEAAEGNHDDTMTSWGTNLFLDEIIRANDDLPVIPVRLTPPMASAERRASDRAAYQRGDDDTFRDDFVDSDLDNVYGHRSPWA